MNRVIFISVCAVSLLFALGVDATGLIYSGATLLIIGAGYSYVFFHRLPRNFWMTLAGLMIGPYILASIIRLVLGQLENTFGSALSSGFLLLIILGLMAISFLYVRLRISRMRNNHMRQPSTNERQAMFPMDNEHEIDRDEL